MKKVMLGIDIGGTNTKFGIVDQNGKCYFNIEIETLARQSPQKMFDRLFAKHDKLTKESDKKFKLVGVGIGAPNGNYYLGSMVNPPNLGWGTVDLVKIVKKYTDVPVKVTNDANAAAVGEMKFGAAKEMKNFILITLGTGLGSGIVVNGKVVYGADGHAGEMGHITAVCEGRTCACGNKGCLETYVSATGVCRTALEMMADRTCDSPLRSFSAKELTSKIIYQAAMDGDSIALETFEKTAQILGKSLADAVAYFSPEAIILFGGLTKAGDLLLKPTKEAMELNLLSIFRNKVELILSGLQENEAAILGAGALIWNELNGKNNQ